MTVLTEGIIDSERLLEMLLEVQNLLMPLIEVMLLHGKVTKKVSKMNSINSYFSVFSKASFRLKSIF